jgi:hypothetical protein
MVYMDTSDLQLKKLPGWVMMFAGLSLSSIAALTNTHTLSLSLAHTFDSGDGMQIPSSHGTRRGSKPTSACCKSGLR